MKLNTVYYIGLYLFFLIVGLDRVSAQKSVNGASFSEKEVRVSSINADLAGTLSIPNRVYRGIPPPAILLITSAGGQTRDQVVSGVPMLKIMAEHLTKAGFVVLRMDDRGTGKSTGASVWDSTTEEKASDMLTCVNFLKKQPEVDPRRIGLVGHSEGAMVAPMVALKDPDIQFVVLLGSPGVTGEEIWNRQQGEEAKQRTSSEAVLKALAAERRKLIEFIKVGNNDNETFYKLGHDYFAAYRMPESENTHQLTDENFGLLRKKWFRFFFAHNPVQNLKKLRIPTLIIFGSADEQVAIDQNLLPISAALVEAKNADFTVSIIPKQNHFFSVSEDPANPEKLNLSPALLEMLTQWTTKQVRRK